MKPQCKGLMCPFRMSVIDREEFTNLQEGGSMGMEKVVKLANLRRRLDTLREHCLEALRQEEEEAKVKTTWRNFLSRI